MNNKEIDLLIAERVMGLKTKDNIPNYSANIENAYKVLYKLRDCGLTITIRSDRNIFDKFDHSVKIFADDYLISEAEGKDVALTICQAIVKLIDSGFIVKDKGLSKNDFYS